MHAAHDLNSSAGAEKTSCRANLSLYLSPPPKKKKCERTRVPDSPLRLLTARMCLLATTCNHQQSKAVCQQEWRHLPRTNAPLSLSLSVSFGHSLSLSLRACERVPVCVSACLIISIFIPLLSNGMNIHINQCQHIHRHLHVGPYLRLSICTHTVTPTQETQDTDIQTHKHFTCLEELRSYPGSTVAEKAHGGCSPLSTRVASHDTTCTWMLSALAHTRICAYTRIYAHTNIRAYAQRHSHCHRQTSCRRSPSALKCCLWSCAQARNFAC